MTLCLSWETADAAFLIADSLVTGGPARGDAGLRTTFGEVLDDQPETVAERALKVIRLAPDAMAAISGESGPALRYVARLRRFLSGMPLLRVGDAMRALAQFGENGHGGLGGSFVVSVASARDGSVERLTLRSDTPEPLSAGPADVLAHGVHLPELMATFLDAVRAAESVLATDPAPPPFDNADLHHALVAGCLQARLMIDPAVAHGVGGALTSAILRPGSARRPRQTTYLLWREETSPTNGHPTLVAAQGADGPGPVSIRYVHECCVVRSDLTGETKVLGHRFAGAPTNVEVVRAMADDLNRPEGHRESEILTIVNPAARRLLIVLRTAADWGDLWRLNEDQRSYKWAFPPELLDSIRGGPAPDGTHWTATVTTSE